jgi:hypothetical protein
MEIVSFEIAQKLKEKGFPQRPNYFNYGSYYNWDGLRKTHSLSNASVWFDRIISRDNIYFAPTISQVLKWLREKDIMVFPVYSTNTSRWYCSIVNADSLDTYRLTLSDSYELAAIAGIKYCLDNLI